MKYKKVKLLFKNIVSNERFDLNVCCQANKNWAYKYLHLKSWYHT